MSRAASGRVMQGVRDVAGRAIPRDAYDTYLAGLLDTSKQQPRRDLLTAAEAEVIASLLDELAAVYEGEQLGQTARQMSSALWDRIGGGV